MARGEGEGSSLIRIREKVEYEKAPKIFYEIEPRHSGLETKGDKSVTFKLMFYIKVEASECNHGYCYQTLVVIIFWRYDLLMIAKWKLSINILNYYSVKVIKNEWLVPKRSTLSDFHSSTV